MAFDPQVEKMRAARAAAAVPQLYTQTVTEARIADLQAIQEAGGYPEPVHEVIDRTVPGSGGELPVRIYRPVGDLPFPTLIYFFGGGWTLGSIDTADGIARRLANATPCQVITVGYRLAPEHRFPVAVHDCHAATQWIGEHPEEVMADPKRIAVGGDSAGANLAAAVTLLAREEGPSLAAQLLVYPNTLYGSDTPSMRAGNDPHLFNRTSVDWYWQHYLADPADGLHPLASPLLADDFTGLPPALVITAEFDPLRDEGEMYADKLSGARVPTKLIRYDGMVHGFFAMHGTLQGGAQAIVDAADFLHQAFIRTD